MTESAIGPRELLSIEQIMPTTIRHPREALSVQVEVKSQLKQSTSLWLWWNKSSDPKIDGKQINSLNLPFNVLFPTLSRFIQGEKSAKRRTSGKIYYRFLVPTLQVEHSVDGMISCSIPKPLVLYMYTWIRVHLVYMLAQVTPFSFHKLICSAIQTRSWVFLISSSLKVTRNDVLLSDHVYSTLNLSENIAHLMWTSNASHSYKFPVTWTGQMTLLIFLFISQLSPIYTTGIFTSITISIFLRITVFTNLTSQATI